MYTLFAHLELYYCKYQDDSEQHVGSSRGISHLLVYVELLKNIVEDSESTVVVWSWNGVVEHIYLGEDLKCAYYGYYQNKNVVGERSGHVMYLNFCHLLAPSISAAS